MPAEREFLAVKIGSERFDARLRRAAAPRSCELLTALLPYVGTVIHARWSGEALWAPLVGAIPADLALLPEHASHAPVPGEVLLYAGPKSAPELLIAYGDCRFACAAGELEGNPVMLIEDGLERLAQLGREALWNGAWQLRIEPRP